MNGLVDINGKKIRTADDVLKETALAVFACELVSVKAPMQFTKDVVAMQEYLFKGPVFKFYVAHHPDQPGMLVAFITSKALGIGAHMAKDWAIVDAPNAFSRILFEGHNGAELVFLVGRIIDQVAA